MYERQALLLLPLVRPLPARLPLPPLRVRGFLGLALAPKLKLIPLAICAALVVVGEAASITASPPERAEVLIIQHHLDGIITEAGPALE